eukprot:scaffold277731_cov30-Tisochrysis_lutea.AAC.7
MSHGKSPFLCSFRLIAMQRQIPTLPCRHCEAAPCRRIRSPAPQLQGRMLERSWDHRGHSKTLGPAALPRRQLPRPRPRPRLAPSREKHALQTGAPWATKTPRWRPRWRAVR